jgi:hypothetical protein
MLPRRHLMLAQLGRLTTGGLNGSMLSMWGHGRNSVIVARLETVSGPINYFLPAQPAQSRVVLPCLSTCLPGLAHSPAAPAFLFIEGLDNS